MKKKEKKTKKKKEKKKDQAPLAYNISKKEYPQEDLLMLILMSFLLDVWILLVLF